MKKKSLALLLSVAIAFSGIPASSLNAAPENTEMMTETEESIVEETISTEEMTESESSGEESSEESSSEETSSESETTSAEEATGETTTETESSEGTTTECASEAVSTEAETIQNETETTFFTEETSEELCETESTEEECILICEDTVSISFPYSGSEWNANYYSANASLRAESFPEEMVEGVPYVELYTLLQNEDAFRGQLSGDFETKLYDAGKKSIVEKGYNYINLSGISDYHDGWDEICNVFSALSAAYPNKFNWMNWKNATFGRQIYYYKNSKTYTYKYTLKKTGHYTSSLEKKAAAKVKTLVTEANAYAKANYPESPAYGIIVYFNHWLCENSYFEREHGMSEEASVQKGKIYYYSHTCYGPLLYGYGTSEGYALAMSRLLDAAGIRNLYVPGSYNGEKPYSEYAWNYVEMPDGYWYLIDALRNDIECDNVESISDYDYLLIPPDEIYESDSRKWKTLGSEEIGKKLDYDAIITAATTNYLSDTSEATQLEELTISDESVVLKPNQKYQLSINDPNEKTNGYYQKFVKTWKSNNTRIAKVDSNGKITAGTVPGKAIITAEAAGKTFTCEVYVYQFTNIKFNANNKTSYSATYCNPDAVFDNEDLQTIELNVNQKNYQITAQAVVSGNNLNEAIAVSNKPRIAKVTDVTLEDDTITLKVLPLAVGSAKITITLAGKKAYYTINIRQDLQGEWFNYSNITETTYSGKYFKPSIPLTESGRDCSPRATYKITYSNNKNAGEATITIKGTGKYSGTITKNFTIHPKDMSTAVFRSCTSSRTYNAKPRAATTNVRLVKSTLKAGRDYTILYKRTDIGYEDSLPSDTIPTEAGTYEISIVGKGNYAGELDETQTKIYTIKPNSINGMTVSYRTSIKYTGEPVSVLKNVKISGNLLPEDNYIVTYQDSTGNESTTAPIEKGKYKLIVTPVENKNITTTLTKTCIKKTFTIK